MKESDEWLKAKDAAEAMIKKHGFSGEIEAARNVVKAFQNISDAASIALRKEKAPAVSSEDSKASDDV